MTGYREIAEKLGTLIDRHVLCAGDRLPSVRHAARNHRVNRSTILRAYRKLEARGLLESRPRSGYYVRKMEPRRVPEPEPATPKLRPTAIVPPHEVLFELFEDIKSARFVRLGLALLDPELLPTEDLNRAAMRTIRRLKPGKMARGLAPGDPDLRRLIALRYLSSGLSVADEDIVIMSGGLEAVVLCLRALTKPGDTIAIETPNWWPQLGAISGLGLQVMEIPTDPRTGVDLAALERAFRSRSIQACLVMPTFQNPLGFCMPEENKQALAKLVARYGIPLIENDRLAEFFFHGARPRPVKAFDDSGFVLHCGCFATCMAPGYQIGWVAAGKYHTQVARTKILLSITPPPVCQAVMAEYLAHGPVERQLRRVRQELATRCEAMVRAISEHFPPGCRMTHPTGGLAVWIELPKSAGSLELYRLVHAKGIDFAPGPMFSARAGYGNCLALYFGLASVQQIQDAVPKIAQSIGPASR
jgi:DNA-binding transcriptional MocR family regulator